MHFFFVLTPPSPSTLQHFFVQIFFNFSRLPFSFELRKKPFFIARLGADATPTVAILKDCVTSVAILGAVQMRNAIQGNDLKYRNAVRKIGKYRNIVSKIDEIPILHLFSVLGTYQCPP